MALHKDNLISMEEALRQASNPEDFALRVRGVSSTSDLTWDDFDKDGTPPKE
jgi:twitching motility protein PilT